MNDTSAFSVPNPGSTFRKATLWTSILLSFLGLFMIYASTTKHDMSLFGIGFFFAANGAAILLPGLSYAAWLTSRTAVAEAHNQLSEPDPVFHASTLSTLAGSTRGWAKWWMFCFIVNVITTVVILIVFLSSPNNAILLYGPAMAIGYTLSCWLQYELMSNQAEDADRVRDLFRKRFKPTIDISRLLASMIPIPDSNYWIGKTPVTQIQWENVMGDNPSMHKNDNNPVDGVSWDDCQEFLKKLNAFPEVKKSGFVFRLPTEEEWEYSCRAGATGTYCKLADGTEITEDTLGKVAWYGDNSDGKTHPVGHKEPNAFGLYDMHGNVWEWTQTGNDIYRISRGGSWDYAASLCGSTDRGCASPVHRSNHLGFRLCAEKRYGPDPSAKGDQVSEGDNSSRSEQVSDNDDSRIADLELLADKAREVESKEYAPDLMNQAQQHQRAMAEALSEGRLSKAASECRESISLYKEAIDVSAKAHLLSVSVGEMIPIPAKDHFFGKYLVTQELWNRVMGNNPSHFKGPDNPVECVSWVDCQEFLKKLNASPFAKKSSLVFRLPTAEEWEYACRAGATGNYCKLTDETEVTEDTLGRVGWFRDNSGKKTHPVGQKEPNSFGLYDMHGNVWEWTQTADGARRITCGGSWSYSAKACSSSVQGKNSPVNRSNDLGFRLCAERRAE